MTTWRSKQPKDPNAVLDYTFDWQRWLQSGETISTVTVTGTNVTIDSNSETGGVVTVWLSGGTAGTEATVAVKIATSDSRTDERSLALPVAER